MGLGVPDGVFSSTSLARAHWARGQAGSLMGEPGCRPAWNRATRLAPVSEPEPWAGLPQGRPPDACSQVSLHLFLW